MEAMKMEVQVIASRHGVLQQKAKTGEYFSAESVLAEAKISIVLFINKKRSI